MVDYVFQGYFLLSAGVKALASKALGILGWAKIFRTS